MALSTIGSYHSRMDSLFLDELQAWAAAGKTARLWLRDDDAFEPNERLTWLVETSGKFKVPLALAVVPDKTSPALAKELCRSSHVTVIQHGFRHVNHGSGTGLAGEFNIHRPVGVMLKELEEGRRKLESLFGSQFSPVLAPPWNKISAELAPLLSQVGLKGLSTSGPRAGPKEGNVNVVNIHVDALKWKPAAHFRGRQKIFRELVGHLSSQRVLPPGDAEPTGYLLHHLSHDRETDQFTEEFFADTSRRSGLRWLSVDELFFAGER